MSDLYDKLGKLLSEKISEEEKNEPVEVPSDGDKKSLIEKGICKDDFIAGELSENCKDSETDSKKISEQIILESLSEKNKVGQVLHAGQFTEDVPVKIISGDVEFK
ncbi:MAG: hypothetical protein MJ181_03370 [Treponema sp.]|nr:hypothetical protein [Treponema sp.]